MKTPANVEIHDVTLVTRNPTAAIVEVVTYAVLLYAATHPESIEWAKDKVATGWKQLQRLAAIRRTAIAISELPEIQ